MTDRATGRTYRKVLEACLEASKGRRVMFAIGNQTELNNVLDQINYHIAAGVKRPKVGMFIYPNGGEIDIRYMQGCFTGERFNVVIEDELLGAGWKDVERYLEKKAMVLR